MISVRANSVAVKILAVGLVFYAFGVQAAITSEVEIESVPTEADVFLLQGTKRTLLGTTPLKTQLEFHSEVSILRLAVSKKGFENQNIELAPTRKRIVVTLLRRGFAASPDMVKSESLRDLHSRIAKKIDQEMSLLTSATAAVEWEPAGAIRPEILDGRIYLMVPVTLDESKREEKAAGPIEGTTSVRVLWDRVAAQFVRCLGKVTSHESAIKGIVVDVTFGQLQQQFAVGSQVESRLVMQCVPGSEEVRVYNPCLRYVSRTYTDTYGGRTHMYTRNECEAGYETKYVYNPCLHKTPVTMSEVKVDPQASTKKVQSRLRFVASSTAIERLMGGNDIFLDIGYVRSDNSGRIIEKKGSLPSALSGSP